MTTQYTPILKLALPVQGELSGTWGDVVNDNITSMIEQAIAGRSVVNTWTANSHVLTTANGTAAESRAAMLSLTDTGTALTGAGSVVCPALSKTYIVKNGTAQVITVNTASGSGIAVPVGKTMLVYCDGTNVLEGVDHVVTLSAGTLTITGLTTFASLKGADATTVTGILDEDNMASDSATKLVTQQSVKAYVDSQVGANNELSEVLANGNTTGGTNIAVSTGDDITFADSSKATFGASDDLQIYHDGNNSLIKDAGTGDLRLRTDNKIVLEGNSGEDYAVFNDNGAVSLNYDNSQKLATTATGIDVTGTVTADDAGFYQSSGTSQLRVGASASYNWNISRDNVSTGGLQIQSKDAGADVTRAFFALNGDVSFYEDTGTTAKFFWDASAESLGIGSGNPQNKLDIEQSAAVSARLLATGATSSSLKLEVKGGATQLTTTEILANSGGALTFATGTTSGTERMRIDSAGKVSIGTASSAGAALDVNHALAGTYPKASGIGLGAISTAYTVASNGGTVSFTGGAGLYAENTAASGNPTNLVFWTNATGTPAEAMRIDSAGNLLVGTTDDVVWNNNANSAADNGHNLRDDGRAGFAYYNATANANATVNINRTGSDGDLIRLFKSGTTIGSIGVQSGRLTVGSNSAAGVRFDGTQLVPMNGASISNNTITLGDADFRFKDLYLSGTATMGGLTVQGTATTRPTIGNSDVNTSGLTTGLNFEPISNLTNGAKLNVINGLQPTVASAYTAGFEFVTEDHSGGGTFAQTKALTIGASGDISFYEDTGTTAKFFWDASAESLGIGTSAPSLSYSIDAAKGIRSSGAAPNFTLQETDASNQTWLMAAYGGTFAIRDTTVSGTAYPFRIEAATPTSTLYLNSAGNVGIGTGSPATKLEVEGNSGAATGTVSAPVAIRITDTSDIGSGGDTTNPYAALQFFSRDLSNEGPIVQAQIGTIYDDEFGAGSNLAFSTWNAGLASPAERMRIDSLGNASFNTTDISPADNNVFGTAILQYGGASMSRTNSITLDLNRSSSDGAIVNFRKDGETVGSIGTNTGNIYLSDGVRGLAIDGDTIYGTYSTGGNANGAQNLGSATQRFNDLYLSGGVVFGATGGSVTSKTLDDYEEGTWTPSFGGATSNPTVSYNTQTATYTKVGRLVTVVVSIVTNSSSGGAGHLAVTGLPFTPSAGQNFSATIGFNYNWVVGETPNYGFGQGNTTQILLYKDAATNTISEPTDIQASGNSYLYLTVSYFTA